MSQRDTSMDSPLMRTQKKFVNLKGVVAKPGPIESTVAIILDATGDYKTDDSYDYVTKIKLVDASYNPSTGKLNKKKGYVMAFVFSSKLSDTPHIRKLGDIILLRNFKFDNYKDVVKGFNSKTGSEWQIFDSRKNTPMHAISCSKEIPSPLTPEEKAAIAGLKDWGFSFFSHTSLYDLGWFEREVSKKRSSNDVLLRRDIDMIVKVVQDVRTIMDGVVYNKLVFVDRDKRMYLAEIKGMGSDFEVNSIVKLRSVTLIAAEENDKIDFYNYSKILILQPHFADSHTLQEATRDVAYSDNLLVKQFMQEFHLDQYQFEQIAPQTYLYHLDKINIEHLEEEKKQLVLTYPVLSSFDTKENSLSRGEARQYGTCIMKKYAESEMLSVNALAQIMDRCNASPDALQNCVGKTYVVEGQLQRFMYYKPTEMFKIYSPSANQTWELDDFETAQQNGIEDLRIIVHNIIFLQDETAEGAEALPLYIATYDQNPQFIFDLWRVLPDCHALADWKPKNKHMQKRFKDFQECLERVEGIKKPYKFVVELTTSEPGKGYFRVIDTIFWFLNSK